MTKPKPSGEPNHITEKAWFYDDKKGLLVVSEARTASGTYIQTDQFIIPWRAVLESARRCGKID